MALQKIQIQLPSRYTNQKKAPTELWELAEKVSNLTGTIPNRWLRDCKNSQWAVERALIDMREAQARSPVKLFQFLLNKYKKKE